MQASIITSPQAPRGYVYDCRLSFNTADLVNVGTGFARDSTSQVDIPVASALQVNMTTNGAGGLDTGARAAQTNYAIYVIMNPATGQVAALASLNFTTPTTLPAGFTVFRRVGAISLNSASGIRPFFMSGLGPLRHITWNLTQGAISDTSCRALNAGNAIVSTVITAANRFFFSTSPDVFVLGTFTSANVGTAGQCGPTGVASILNQVAIIAQVAAVAAQDRGSVSNVAGAGTISYQVPNAADALSLWVQGCTDQLAA